jgi:hypothetical protein
MTNTPITVVTDDSDTDLNRRRCMFKIAKAAATTAAVAATLYMAPLVVRIDEAEAKGSKRGGGSRRRGASARRRAPSVRGNVPSRRRIRNRRRRIPSRLG